MVNLETTNWLLGAIAVASVVQTLMLLGVADRRIPVLPAGDCGSRGTRVAPRRAAAAAGRWRSHPGQQRPQRGQSIAARVNHQTERVDGAISGTIERVDETADRLKERVRDKVSQWTGVVRGIRAVIAALLTTEPSAQKPPAAASGRL